MNIKDAVAGFPEALAAIRAQAERAIAEAKYQINQIIGDAEESLQGLKAIPMMPETFAKAQAVFVKDVMVGSRLLNVGTENAAEVMIYLGDTGTMLGSVEVVRSREYAPIRRVVVFIMPEEEKPKEPTP